MSAMDDLETATCPHCGEAVDPAMCRNVVPEPSGRHRVQRSCYKCGEHIGAGADEGRFA